MDFASSEMSATVFKRIVRDDIGKFPLDRQMLVVFMELDGKAPLSRVAQKTGLNMSTMREIIAKLMQNGLVEKVDKEIIALDKDFIEYMVAHLALALGPVAQVLVEDEIYNLGHEINRFPVHRLAELVDNLAREIRRAEKKEIFLKMMAIKIKEKGYVMV
jgi:Mn-dependent DtxR family transcriptional regulator